MNISICCSESTTDFQHRFGVNSLATNTSHTRLFSAGRDASVREWNLENLVSELDEMKMERCKRALFVCILCVFGAVP